MKLAKIAIGDGTLGSVAEYQELPTVKSACCVDRFVALSHLPQLTVIQTYPQLIGYDTAVYEYFKEQSVITPNEYLNGVDVTPVQNQITPMWLRSQSYISAERTFPDAQSAITTIHRRKICKAAGEARSCGAGAEVQLL